jgi:enoyl-[acyl-carrier-protein] reductase (NADH)
MLREVAAAAARREQRGVEEVLDDYIGEAAEHRMVRPEEVASVAVWLASPEASGINGESINVDAGALTG